MIVHKALTGSTQEDAKALAKDGCDHGVVVVADVQTGGRGRRGRAWVSGPHGLWMSIVLRTSLPMPKAPRLALCACDVVARVVVDKGADVFVKWPNDLLVPSTTTHPVLGPFQKAGGLLVEAVDVDATTLKTAVLGIGINLRVPDGGFPDDVKDVAAAALVDVDVDKLGLAEELQRRLRSIEDAVVDDGEFAAVRSRLAERSATLRRRVSVDGLSGTAVAIADDGALVIEGDDGRRRTIHAGDVAVVG